jgi:hypothetical protein
MSLYGGGWVTLSGLPFGDSSSTIEHRQQIIDEIVAELRPELNAEIATFHERASAATGAQQVREAENFILDWSRTASESHIRQFLQGWNRTSKQRQDITETWELKTRMEPWKHARRFNVYKTHCR